MRASILPASIIPLLLCSIPTALGDIQFVSPAAGVTVAGGGTVTVTWKDSGVAPLLADLLSYDLFLYTGGNTAPLPLTNLKPAASFATGNSATVTIPLGVGGTGANAYFLGMKSVAKAGGIITNYSGRFTLTGMTGTFSPDIAAANQAVVGTAGPPKVNAVAAAPAAGVGGTIDPGAWGTPYNLQSGAIRYAPMQPIPPTKITKTDVNPLWPTSSVPLATTFLPIAPIPTTQTQPQTYSAASHANTAAPQSHPTDDMQKFLNRWKD